MEWVGNEGHWDSPVPDKVVVVVRQLVLSYINCRQICLSQRWVGKVTLKWIVRTTQKLVSKVMLTHIAHVKVSVVVLEVDNHHRIWQITFESNSVVINILHCTVLYFGIFDLKIRGECSLMCVNCLCNYSL